MINPKEATEIEASDLEWGSYLIRQAQICKAEAHALEQVVMSKLQAKYSIQMQYGDGVDLETGKIHRAKMPEMPKT